MDSEIATASRNVTRIKLRRAVDLSHKAVRKAGRLLTDWSEPSSPDSVCLFPPIGSRVALGDLLNRLGWYLPERTATVDRIVVPTSLDPSTAVVPDCQPTYDHDHLPVEFVRPGETEAALDAADLALVWSGRLRWLSDPRLLSNVAKTHVVDPGFYLTAESTEWKDVTSRLRTGSMDASRRRFAALERQFRDADRAFVFATGPSLSEAAEMTFPSDALMIVCNSIVKNDDLLTHLDPDVLTFADPVFHFGPSRYAARFRADAVDVLRQYDCVGVTQREYHDLLSGHFPSVEEDLIGVDLRDSRSPIYPTADRLEVMRTGNVMTRLMLPVAASLADEVYVVGADGRDRSESYFWEHDDSAQYDDELMNAAADCHPSFFRDRVYTDYYDRHVETLESMIEHGERRGVDYHNLTHSYMDCLSDRRISPSWA